MVPTRSSVLFTLALVAGALSWIVVSLDYDSLPAVPVVGPITLVLLAIAELLFALSVRRRLRNPSTPVQQRLEPMFVARLAVLAKASSHAAALVAGLYGGFFVYTLGHLGKPKINSDSWASGLSLVASLALIAAALFLEFSCRVPKPPDDDARPPGPRPVP
jgi:Protein of unknown function (DUF3180)